MEREKCKYLALMIKQHLSVIGHDLSKEDESLVENVIKCESNYYDDCKSDGTDIQTSDSGLNLDFVSNNEERVVVNCGNCIYINSSGRASPCIECNKDYHLHKAID